ncbi:hypothetical protein BWQ93_05810 [Sphingopyxis sp. QXT-31]|uniref:hypothetical protein n=1 Tax=Sphingopyxis sp. QXT-31 TaxID=1357916 RepID=UPI00097940C7|nr:hypothetical protein [Sphingopyxis sp. QXT-31]APZ98048.1 hypothetical protein BWQ93_05810 [Sphingopyxis sp. QXT-31]
MKMERISSAVPPETLALMVELLPSIESLRDLCAVTGLSTETVRRQTEPFIAIMKLQGTLPKCPCGRDKFHPYGCTFTQAKKRLGDRIAGVSPEESERLLHRRRLGIDMLVAGDRYSVIDEALGMKRGGARNYLRFLSPEQLEARERAMTASKPEEAFA